MATTNEVVAILEEIQKINKKQDVLTALLQARPQSERKELTTALASAQAQFNVAKPVKENPYYKTKYETIADLVSASRNALCKNGLSVSFTMSATVEDGEMLTCVLSHSSGQELHSSIRLMQHRGDPRARVSEIEYLKRMMYAALVGVVADDDDDADKAMRNYRLDGEGREKEVPKQREPDNVITHEQLEILRVALKTCPDTQFAEKILTEYDIRYLSELPKGQFRVVYERIEKIKNTYASAKGYEQ